MAEDHDRAEHSTGEKTSKHAEKHARTIEITQHSDTEWTPDHDSDEEEYASSGADTILMWQSNAIVFFISTSVRFSMENWPYLRNCEKYGIGYY